MSAFHLLINLASRSVVAVNDITVLHQTVLTTHITSVSACAVVMVDLQSAFVAIFVCNKGRGMCYTVCGMVHMKEPLLLIDKSSLCGGSRFPFSLSQWSLTICLTPYNRR